MWNLTWDIGIICSKKFKASEHGQKFHEMTSNKNNSEKISTVLRKIFFF